MIPRLTAALAGAGVLAAGALGLYWKGRIEGAARERPKLEAARAEAAIAGLETRGERESAGRAEVAARRRETAAQAATQLTLEALKSEDAHAPLDAARRDRLRALDQRLCEAAPELAGCAKAGDPRRGAPALRTPRPAGRADPG